MEREETAADLEHRAEMDEELLDSVLESGWIGTGVCMMDDCGCSGEAHE